VAEDVLVATLSHLLVHAAQFRNVGQAEVGQVQIAEQADAL
jgi:hypothetical protein